VLEFVMLVETALPLVIAAEVTGDHEAVGPRLLLD
jgi:hypothetical protein